jgi:hypothetical protein
MAEQEEKRKYEEARAIEEAKIQEIRQAELLAQVEEEERIMRLEAESFSQALVGL